MPNQPKTPLMAVRVERELQDRLKEIASMQGRTISDVARDALREYVEHH